MKDEVLKCEECIDISELEIEYPDEPHHGGIRACGLCDAEYYEEFGGIISASNEAAQLNHPELKVL